ncbi:MAG: TraB/GumN family protein [Bacteroidota bacterium]
MYPLKQSLLFLLFSFTFALNSSAQIDRSNYALLWEISGQGLEKPSYLFGTMHVRDPRVFEFSDSVMIALDASEAFAMELHPDSLVDFMLRMYTTTDTTNQLKAMLSKEAYQDLNAAVIAKTGEPIDSMDNKDPMLISMLLEDFDEPETENRKDQFLDLYLYKQAYNQNKAIYGVEELRDYTNLTRSFFRMFEKGTYNRDHSVEPDSAAMKAFFDRFVATYASGDLEKMEVFIEQFKTDEEYEYEMLNRRNRNMADNLARLAQQQTIFCAVGAAHLFGEEGVIRLMEQKGFRMRRVSPTFTGMAAQYVEQPNTRPWVSYDNPERGFGIDMPRESVNLFTNQPELKQSVDIQLAFEMTEMAGFFAANADWILDDPDATKDSLYLQILEAWNNNEKVEPLSIKPVFQGDKEGREVIMKTEESYFCWQLFSNNGYVYLFGVAREENRFEAEFVRRFFASIRLSERPEAERPVYNWQPYNSENGGYTIEFPGEPEGRRVAKPAPDMPSEQDYILYPVMYGMDDVAFLVRHNDIPLDGLIKDETKLVEYNQKALDSSFGNPKIKPDSVLLDGHWIQEVDYFSNSNKIRVRLVNRGGRSYLVMGIMKPQAWDEEVINRFLNSFRFTPLKYSPLKEQAIPEINARISLPNELEIEKDTIQSDGYPHTREIAFLSRDTLSGAKYYFIQYEYSPYFQITDPVQQRQEERTILEEDEYLSAIIDTSFMGSPAWYAQYDYPRSSAQKHSLFFNYNRYLYELLIVTYDAVPQEQVWQFFNTFQTDLKADNTILLSDKSARLFADLRSTDEQVWQHAKDVLPYLDYDSTHLPSIYQLLQEDFPFDQQSGYVYTTKESLLDILTYTYDEQTVPFLEKYYSQNQTDTTLCSTLLSTLLQMGSPAALDRFYTLAKDFQKDRPTTFTVTTTLLNPLQDSMELAIEQYPRLMDLFDNPSMRRNVIFLTQKMLRDSVKGRQVIYPYANKFLKEAQRIVNQYGLVGKEGDLDCPELYKLEVLHHILGFLPQNPTIDTYLRSTLTIANYPLLYRSILSLVHHEQAVEATHFLHLGEDFYELYYLLDELKSMEKLSLLPAKLRRQEKVAQAIMDAHCFHYLENELDQFDIIDQQQQLIEGEEHTVYIFHFVLENTDEVRLGACSQPADHTTFSLRPAYLNYTDEGQYDPQQKAAILQGWFEE